MLNIVYQQHCPNVVDQQHCPKFKTSSTNIKIMPRVPQHFTLTYLVSRVGRFNPPPGLNPGLTRVGLNPLFGLNWVKPGLNWVKPGLN